MAALIMQTYKIYTNVQQPGRIKNKIFIARIYLFYCLLSGFNSSGVKTKTKHICKFYYLTLSRT
jgi:hypothetical protein